MDNNFSKLSCYRAHQIDPDDPQIILYLSLQLALVRQVSVIVLSPPHAADIALQGGSVQTPDIWIMVNLNDLLWQ